MAASKMLAHLVNQLIIHELLALEILALFLVTICISSIALTKKTQNSSSKNVNDSYAEAYGQANNNLYAVNFYIFICLGIQQDP